MWQFFGRSFEKNLTVFFDISKADAKSTMAKAKGKYKEIIENLVKFEKGDRFQMNIIGCAMLAAVVLSMPERPDVDKLKGYYRNSMMTGTDKKNLAGLRSYPDNVQQAVRKHEVFGKIAPKEKSMISVLFGNLLLFTIVFSVLGLILKNPLGLIDFGTTFWFILALGEGLGVFDLVIIDLLWWRNTKRIRFSFLPEKTDYQNPDKHIGSFCS